MAGRSPGLASGQFVLIRSLSVNAKADVLGRSFQGRAAIRALSEADNLRLLEYAKNLPLQPIS